MPHELYWLMHLNSLKTQLFGQELIQANEKESIKAPHYLPFVCEEPWVTGNHNWPMVSSCKEPLIRRVFPYHDIIMGLIYAWILNSVLFLGHCNDVIMGAMASQIASLTIVSAIVYSGADQRKHQSSASLSFVRGIHRWHEFPTQMASNMENVSIFMTSSWHF